MPMGLFDMQEQPPQTFGDRLRAGMRSGSLIDSLALAANSLRDRPDQNIAQIVQGRQERRDEKATANRTAAWLASQGREDLAQAMLAGGLDPKSAVAAHMAAMTPADPLAAINLEKAQIELQNLQNPVADPLKEIELETKRLELERLRNPQAALSPDQLTAINTIRDDVRAELAPFEIVKQGYGNITTFYSNPNATSDYALAVAFAKVLDPGSVAREGEVAAVQNAGARIPALGQALRNAVTGEGSLTPEVRQQIAELATQIYTERAGAAQTTLDSYTGLAKQAGVPAEFIYSGVIPEAQAVIPAVVPQSAVAVGVNQEDWDVMTQDERRAFMEGQ
jgi:hypothetical protein